METVPQIDPRTVRWHMPLVLAFAAVCCAAVWTFFAASIGSVLSWLSVVVAMDIAWFIRRIGWPFRDSRPVVSMLFTAAAIILANYWMAAMLYSGRSAFNLWQALAHIGSPQSLLKIRLMNSAADWFFYGLALFLASILASRRDRQN